MLMLNVTKNNVKHEIRKRVWYRAIDDLERGIINLTVRVVENVKSHNLVQALEGIARANIQI